MRGSGETVKRRATILVLSSLLAAVFIAGGLVEWWLSSQIRIAPILDRNQRLALTTYGMECHAAGDCEPPLVCTVGRLGYGCYDSECLTDVDCSLGRSCQVLHGFGSWTRSCVNHGERQAGEKCEEMAINREQACARGLICNQVCGSPCGLSQPESCPQGSVCRDGPNGPMCLPSCHEGGCPAGTECIQIKGDISTCAQVVGHNCQKTPCPAGQDCQPLFDSLLDVVGLRCMTPCSDESACPTGSACVYGHCRQRCQPGDAGGCGPNEVCTVFPQVANACELRPAWAPLTSRLPAPRRQGAVGGHAGLP